MQGMAEQPGKPVGEALDWSEEEIDRLAEITPEDVTSAKALSRRLMPKKVQPVLDAKKEDGETTNR
jgi:hypothetical protein